MRIPNLAVTVPFSAPVAFWTHLKAKSVEQPWDPIIGIHAPADKYMRADANSIVCRLAPSTLSHLGKPQPRFCLHSYPDILGALRFGAVSQFRCFAFLAVYKLMAIPKKCRRN